MRTAIASLLSFCLVLLGVMGMVAASARADSGAPVERRTYSSKSGRFSLTVDPRWDRGWNVMSPLFTFTDGRGEAIWLREPEDFEDFDFPLDVKISNDGRYLVFGGFSAHNVSFDLEYREGLRIYEAATGRLIRFVSRRDLPPGSYGVSTAWWYDEDRTSVAGGQLHFFTPVRSDPIVFDLASGEVLEGRLDSGQGEDRHGWLSRALQSGDGDEEELWSRVVYEPSGGDPVFSDSIDKFDPFDDIRQKLVATEPAPSFFGAAAQLEDHRQHRLA